MDLLRPVRRKKTHKKEENPTQKKLKIEFQNTFIYANREAATGIYQHMKI